MPFSARIVWADVNNVFECAGLADQRYRFASAVSPHRKREKCKGPASHSIFWRFCEHIVG